MLTTDRARAMAGSTQGCPPHPRIVAMQLADFRRLVHIEALHMANIDLDRQEAIWRYGMKLKLDAFDWRGHEAELEAFAADLARVVHEGIRIRRSPQPGGLQGAR